MGMKRPFLLLDGSGDVATSDLPATGDPGLGLWFDGSGDVATSNLTTAITGDLEVIAKIRAVDWTPSVNQRIVSQWGTGNANFTLWLNTDGTLVFSYSTDGTAGTNKVSTVALGATAGLTDNLSDIWVKVTHDVDNGAGGNDVKFYYSTDGVAWTQLGTTVTTAGTVTRFGSTESHRVGAYAGTSNPWNGRIYSAQVLNGIGGAAVLNPDFTAWTVGQTSKADAIGNTWTLTGCFVIPASSITGDLDVRVKCRAVDWTPASAMYLVSHAVDATHFGWGLRLLATSAPDFVFTVDGSTFIQHLCTASLPGVVDNVTDIWIKVTFDADDGLGNAVTKFYTSSDGSTWTQLGSTVTDAAGPYVLYSPAATGMKVGAYTSAGLGGWNGYIYKAEIRNGIAGTVVANPDFTDYIWGTGDTVNNDAKGNAWTLTNAKIIAYETDVNCDQPNEWEYPVLVPTGSEPTNLNGSY